MRVAPPISWAVAGDQRAWRHAVLDNASAPPSPEKRSPMKWLVHPSRTGLCPWCVSPIRVPQSGRPDMEARVPSIGSSTQTYSASSSSEPNSSPRCRDPENAADHVPHDRSPAPDRLGHGSKSAPDDFVADRQRLCRKKGRIVAPGMLWQDRTRNWKIRSGSCWPSFLRAHAGTPHRALLPTGGASGKPPA